MQYLQQDAKSSGASNHVKKRQSSRIVKPRTDRDFLYDMALPAWFPNNKELSTTPKLAELFSKKKASKTVRDVKPKREVKSNVLSMGTEAGGKDETSGWLHDGLFWPILLLVDLAMSIIRKREQTET